MWNVYWIAGLKDPLALLLDDASGLDEIQGICIVLLCEQIIE